MEKIGIFILIPIVLCLEIIAIPLSFGLYLIYLYEDCLTNKLIDKL